jgi:hypothetical protein
MEVSRLPGARPGSMEPASDGGAQQFRPYRNGLPVTPGYAWRRRKYPWAERAIEMAEAKYGPPRPVCEFCGAGLVYGGGFGRCPNCRPRGPRTRRRVR